MRLEIILCLSFVLYLCQATPIKTDLPTVRFQNFGYGEIGNLREIEIYEPIVLPDEEVYQEDKKKTVVRNVDHVVTQAVSSNQSIVTIAEQEKQVVENVTTIVTPVAVVVEIDREYIPVVELRSLVDATLPDEELMIRDICSASYNFKYYQPYPTDISKYILCDSWGKNTVLTCEAGLVWDSFTLKCVLPSEWKKDTETWLFNLEKTLSSFDCNLQETSCLNGGICQNVSGVYKCVCSSNFTGDLCEIKIDPDHVYTEIVGDRFSFDQYSKKLQETLNSQKWTNELNLESVKQFGEQAVAELEKYLKLHNKSEIRYDQVINTLVEDILVDIYPDAYTLSLYNASTEKVSNVIRFIPNLISYAKYSSERYEFVFNEYQQTLNKLVEVIKASDKVVPVRATGYVEFIKTLTNYTTVFNESIIHNNTWSSEAVVQNMQGKYNETIVQTNTLVKMLEEFQSAILVEFEKNPKIGESTLSESDNPAAKEFLQLLNNITRSSAIVWESMVGYGFWFITNSMANY